jgi:hypothetical protein
MIQLAGGERAAAAICGVSAQLVSNWQLDSHDKTFIPIYRLLDLDAAAGDLFLKEWARARGYELVSSGARPDSTESLLRTLAQFSKHTGELEYTTLDAAEDGQLTPAEKRRIRDHVAPVKNIISQLEGVIS